jgi:ABC-type dipeptide/oligopeptide/nickel transport system permease component
MGITVLVSLLVVTGALIADAAYAALDPRVRRA